MMPHRSRFANCSLAVLACAAAAGGASAAAASPEAHAAQTCNVQNAPSYPGQGYFTSLRVTGTGCASGGKLMVAYYHCRTNSGGKRGHCHGHVRGYSCHEGKRMSTTTEFDARVTCHHNGATIVHTYQQSLGS